LRNDHVLLSALCETPANSAWDLVSDLFHTEDAKEDVKFAEKKRRD